MKLSLKEFFMPEAGDLPKGDEPLQRPAGMKKFKNLPKGDEPLGEKAGDQFSGPKFGQSSSAEKTRKANEDTLKEYEDPTSSKHSEGDSKWASPGADTERVPHLEPHSGAQENSADGWEKASEDSGGKSSSDPSLKQFFGGAHMPKSSHGRSSKKSSRKMSEAVDDDAGSSMHHSQYEPGGIDVPTGDDVNFKCPECGKDSYQASAETKEPSTIDCPHCDAHFDEQQVEIWAQTLWPYPDGDEKEIPSGDMDDYGFTGGEEDYDEEFGDPLPGVQPTKGKSEGKFDNWNPRPWEPEDKMSEGGKGSGRKKGSKNRPKDEFGNVISQPKAMPAGDVPDELPDDWFTGIDAMGTGEPKPDQPADPSGFEAPEDDIDWSSMDDEEFLNKLSAGEGPKSKTYEPPKMKDTIKQGPPADTGKEMTWDEFRASYPEEAAEFEERYPTDGAMFKIRPNGLIKTTSKDGRRLMHMGDNRGWADMDADEPPGQSTGLGPSAPGEF